MAVKIIMSCPTSAFIKLGDGTILPVKSGILYDEDGDIVMTIGNYKEALTNVHTQEPESSREDLR